MILRFALLSCLIYSSHFVAQGCCSGGSGSPIAGGSSQGVLQEKQLEFSSNFQYTSSNRFIAQNRDTVRMFENLSSNYIYTRIAYGVSKKLTFSLETGYFINKRQIELNHADTIQSSGIADLIVFPRYELFNQKTDRTKTEFTIGLGYKIPLGKYNDSTLVYTNPYTNQEFYTTSPPIIQPTNGSQDFIFYSFAYREYFKPKIKFFTSLIYIKKGWNPLGQKFGDYASLGLFANKMIYKKRIGLTLQVRGELIQPMKYDKNIDILALYNIDPLSTGSRKVFIVPQLSYNYKKITFYAYSDIPLYQYLDGMQIASQFQITAGFSYRFLVSKSVVCEPETE